MFWAMMYLLLFGGSLNPELSIIPDEEIFRKAIKAPHRLEQVLEIRKEVKLVEQELSTATKNRYEELAQLTPLHDADIEQFRAIFARLDETRLDSQKTLLDYRFRLKEKMTREEWKKVYGKR
jgi:hypothetical protein